MINECVHTCLCYLIDMDRNQMFKEKRRKICLAAGKEVLGRKHVLGLLDPEMELVLVCRVG